MCIIFIVSLCLAFLFPFSLLFFTGSIARSASRRYLIYSEADFEVFRPQGRQVAPMGVKYGVEEGTVGPLLHAKFHPHRCNGKGVGPPKTENFTQI